ncbi:MAG: GNAT family N-acetyltransferase [Bdellovibrionota bacterium]
MKLRSIGYFTDISLLQYGGRVEDRGEYVVAETPDNPGYFWGNLLVMREIPHRGDYARWTALFRKEFAHQPLVKHMTFGWDSPVGEVGEVQEFLDHGFQLEHAVILAAEKGDIEEPKNINHEVEIRALRTDAEWQAAIANQMSCRLSDFKEDAYLPFKTLQMNRYRKMAEAGIGNWYGAFLEGKLVADCGLFFFEKIGRYQSVGTHPEFRGRGICARLIYETAKMAFERGWANTLVMSADPEYHAARVYESVGFSPKERIVGMFTYPKEEWTKVSDEP